MKVMIFGTFDLFHEGHAFFIKKALERGDITIIVARDEHVRQIKGKLPKHTESERVAAIERSFPDVHIALGDADDFLQPVRTINPDLILLGYDQKLPPGVDISALSCPVECLPAYKPDMYKTSLMREVD